MEQDTPDLDFEFSVSVTDRDGDVYRGFDTTFDDFKIKVDGTGVNNDPENVAPTAFGQSYDSESGLLSLAAKDTRLVMDADEPTLQSMSSMKGATCIDCSGMAPEIKDYGSLLIEDSMALRPTFSLALDPYSTWLM